MKTSRRLVGLLVVLVVVATALNSARASSILTLVVQGTSGNPISNFRYIVNENNVGDPLSPDPADWPSIKPDASHSPVVAVGDQATASLTLADGKYLVSVLASGHKLGGRHVTIPDETGPVVVQLVPHPLPLSTIRVHVFHDDHPVNGEADNPLKSGLAGFNIVIDDTAGEVTVDYFGNPLATQYQEDKKTGAMVFAGEGNPIPVPGTGGLILTDPSGDAVVENLPPGQVRGAGHPARRLFTAS